MERTINDQKIDSARRTCRIRAFGMSLELFHLRLCGLNPCRSHHVRKGIVVYILSLLPLPLSDQKLLDEAIGQGLSNHGESFAVNRFHTGSRT